MQQNRLIKEENAAAVATFVLYCKILEKRQLEGRKSQIHRPYNYLRLI